MFALCINFPDLKIFFQNNTLYMLNNQVLDDWVINAPIFHLYTHEI